MIDYRVISTAKNCYIECLPEGGLILHEQDALDLVAACVENGANRVMLHAANLNADFYNLRTGLAGAVLQKLSNYSVKLAAVLTPELVGDGRFKEMVLEANRRSREFHVFYEREEAEIWLLEE